jgi:Fis family transcriptional regulator
MVLDAVEKPMLEVVMRQARGNQTHAAQILGMSRNTLHKRLVQYGLDQ